ncbi:MAG: tRNA (guanine(10)-N(2))-dimethyltransferase [Nanoarchaeota archaeon]|nr:tRNA (guanine(10)-N(2))-dimethyltransferase [Nanoarchaeota archaeon]
MKTRKIKEGKINLFVPKENLYEAAVFYNPKMAFNRNISVAAVQSFVQSAERRITILDALSASGARGLRYAKEILGVKEIFLNDKNPIAYGLIKKNINLNKLKMKCKPAKTDANILMHQIVFDVIDIDPFGSPNIFLDAAARSIYHKGFLAVTATDTAPLSGSYPETCFKKYGIRSMKTDYYSELGVRILVSHIILALARRERAFVPVMSFAKEHYFRVFGRIEHAGEIKNLLNQFEYVMQCFNCGNRKIGELELKCSCGNKFDFCGPVFLGNISDKKFCLQAAKECKQRKFIAEETLAKQLASESELPPFYYDLHYLARVAKIRLPKLDEFIARLRKNGFKAGRTHFCPTAVKTDADYGRIVKMLK